MGVSVVEHTQGNSIEKCCKDIHSASFRISNASRKKICILQTSALCCDWSSQGTQKLNTATGTMVNLATKVMHLYEMNCTWSIDDTKLGLGNQEPKSYSSFLLAPIPTIKHCIEIITSAT